MKNYKKIGMTALAASLVSTSAFAGAITVSGGASLGVGQYSGPLMNAGKSFSMGNELTFTGGGTLENGLNVAISMEIDQGKAASSNSPFEAQSLTISRDDLGTLVFAGVDGGSAGSQVHGTAAGNIWDNFDSATSGSVAGAARLGGGATDNSFKYTTPALVEGLNLFGSFNPTTAGKESYTGYGISYSGIAGLTASVAKQDVEGTANNLDGDQKVFKLSYAFGPITVAASDNDYKTGTGANSGVAAGADVGQETRSYAISYTLSEAISVNYGTETIESGAAGDQDAKFQSIGGSYTMGGMSFSAKMQDAENVNHSTNAVADQEYWFAGLSFAF